MAICLVQEEIHSMEKDTLNSLELLSFFEDECNRESLVAIYDSKRRCEGVISYRRFLQSESIEDALLREKVYFDKNIWTNVSNILFRYRDVNKIPIFADDDSILYIAYNEPKLTESIIKLCELAKDDQIWLEVSSVHIKGMNEVLYYLEKVLKRKGVSVSVEGDLWEWFGVSSASKAYLPGLQVAGEDGVWIDELYFKLEAEGRKNVWDRKKWKSFCTNIKEKNQSVIFCAVPGATSELIYDAFLQEDIFPKGIMSQSQFNMLYGKRVNDFSGSPEGVWCLAGVKDDIRTNIMFETVVRNQGGFFERIYLLSGVECILSDVMLHHMIRYCGKVVLMGEKRLCGLFEEHCMEMEQIPVIYVENQEYMIKNANEGIKEALWFYLDFPSQEASDQFKEISAECMQEGIYLSRYFLNHYMFYGDGYNEDRFTHEEIVRMKCLKQLQIWADEYNIDYDKQDEYEHNILFIASHLSYLWDGIAPLFKHYAKRMDTECTVMLPSVWDILKIGERNLKETVDNISEIRKLGGRICFYKNWHPDRKFDVCYTSLGFSFWNGGGIDIDIRKASKKIISLQTTAFHTHYYIGNQKFEDMFGELQWKDIDYAVVSSFMADWVGQRGEKWRNKLLPFGYPRMDSLYMDLNKCQIPNEWKKKAQGKRVIYSTAFSVDLFRYCFEYCKDNKLLLIWRPHPYDFSSPRTRKRIEEWKNKDNVLIDTNQIYSTAFCISDALITTFNTSVQINYMFTDKPILVLDKGYLGINNEIEFQEEAWYKAAYAANDERTCKEFVDMIMDGRDDKRDEKLPYRQFMQQGFDGKVCERIAEFIDGKFEKISS